MKLWWFEKNLPSQVPMIQDMVLDEVMSLVYIRPKHLLITTKLQKYEPTENGNSGPLCGEDDWAADLLGLGPEGSAIACGSQRGVDSEFNAYLMDPMASAMPLAYWQVSNCLFCFHLLIVDL